MKNLLIIAMSLVYITVHGQETYRHYSTNEYNAKQESKNLDLKLKRGQIENDVLKSKDIDTTGQLNIVTIFHVMLADPNEIKDQDIKEQIKILNDCFNTKQNLHPKLVKYDGKKKYNTSIASTEFCVSNNSSGITRKVFLESNPPDSILKSTQLGGSSPMQPEKYLNIWITQLDKNHAGYAQWPGGSVSTDGIVINADYFANKRDKSRKYEMGRTLVHLVGSYLGLIELWGKVDGICDDDYVSDTPIHNGPNYTADGSYHISLCTDEIELINNYMDCTDDEYVNHFTSGQVMRMRRMLASGGPRNTLTMQDCSENKLKDELTVSRASKGNIKIIPNPNSGIFTVKSENINFIKTIIIHNIDGKQVLYNQYDEGVPEIQIDLTSHPDGLYSVDITLDNKDREVHKIVVFK